MLLPSWLVQAMCVQRQPFGGANAKQEEAYRSSLHVYHLSRTPAQQHGQRTSGH
jgi:hypothetical protein